MQTKIYGYVLPWHLICRWHVMNMAFLEIIVVLLGVAAFHVVYTETLRFFHHRKDKPDGVRLTRTQTHHSVTLHAIDLK